MTLTVAEATRIKALEDRCVMLENRLQTDEAILGDWTVQVTKENLASLKVEIPGSGQYPVAVALKVASIIEFEQREMINEQVIEIAKLQTKVTALEARSAPAPSPTPSSPGVRAIGNVLEIGPQIAAALATAQATGHPVVLLNSGPGAGGDAMIMAVVNLPVDNTYGGGADGGPNRQKMGVNDASTGRARRHIVSFASDAAFRLLLNHKALFGDTPGDPNMGQMLTGWENNNAWYWDAIQAAVLPPNEWSRQDRGGGKMFVVLPGGRTEEIGRYAAFGSHRAGRGIEEFVSPTVAEGRVIRRTDGDGRADPNSLYVGGGLRRLTIKVVNGEEVFAPGEHVSQ